MKKQVILLLVMIAVGTVSCKKFLLQLPQDTAAPETFYNNKEQLTAAVMSVYSPLGNIDESTYSRFLSLEAPAASDEYCLRSATSTTASIYNASASYTNFGNCWNNL